MGSKIITYVGYNRVKLHPHIVCLFSILRIPKGNVCVLISVQAYRLRIRCNEVWDLDDFTVEMSMDNLLMYKCPVERTCMLW